MGQSQSTPNSSQPATAPVPPPGCPMHQKTDDNSNSAPPASITEMASGGARHAPIGSVNPVNNIPELQQQPAPGQKMALPLERTISSIPRANPSSSTPPPACPVAHGNNRGTGPNGVAPTPPAEKNETWEYPSPQQFYNALVRKGWETPEESIETIVEIHNHLNEGAWQEVRRWEEQHDGSVSGAGSGLRPRWRAKHRITDDSCPCPCTRSSCRGDRAMLASFTGRPKDLSPKARYHMLMGQLFPNTYG